MPPVAGADGQVGGVGGLDLGAGFGVEGEGDLDKGEEVSRSLCWGEGDWRAGVHLA